MRLRAWSQVLAPLGMLLLAIGLRVAEPRLVQEAQLKVFDTFQRLHPRPYQQAPVRILDVDDESLARLGQWPWPRTQVADLVTRLTELGAAVIVFDVVFAEPDRTSPQRVIPLWPDSPELRAAKGMLEKLPDHDDILARAIAAGPVVTGFVLTSQPGGRPPTRKAGFSWGGESPIRFLPNWPGTVTSLPQLEASASGVGSFAIKADSDGIYRRVPLVFRHGDELYPSLLAEALRVAVGGSTFLIRSAGASGEMNFGESTGITQVRIPPAFTVPTDAEGRVWLHPTVHRPERTVPAWQVMTGDVAPDRIEGHIVFIGTSASGLKDLRPTALDPVAAGVSVHAEVTEQILTGHFLSRPDWATGAEVLAMTAMGLILLILLPRAGALWCAVGGATALGLVLAFSWNAFTQWQWLIDPVYPSLAVLAVYLAGSLMGFLRTEAERRQVRGAFSRYLSPELVKELAGNPDKLVLGGETRNMTILFSDVRGFTTISEQLDAQQLTRLMNRFLTPITDSILKHRGTIDKYMGDCVMAFWNAPLDDAEHARHACHAALIMLDELAALNEELRKEAEAEGRRQLPLRIGVGINTGEVCVGNMGSEQRLEYSVIGDAVNLASRLEGQSKTYGVTILIGEETHGQIPDHATLELDLIRVKGKTQPARIFTLLGGSELKETSEFQQLADRHAELLKAYRAQEWPRAQALLEECRSFDFDLSGLYEVYAERIEGFRAEPPGADWDGTYTAVSK